MSNENNEFNLTATIEKSKKLRIVSMAIGEMGHFFPIVRVTAALEKAGHEVLAVLTNGYAEEKARRTLEHHGVKAPLICPENYPRLTIWRGLDNPDVP
jgi:UDP-N-acetylglucosamine:LPS N-acetylglucosamine transferase